MINNWNGVSLVKVKVVIPIIIERRNCEAKWMMVKGGLMQHYNPSHVASTRIFPIEHTFAMKVHKSQGSTLNYVIISF